MSHVSSQGRSKKEQPIAVAVNSAIPPLVIPPFEFTFPSNGCVGSQCHFCGSICHSQHHYSRCAKDGCSNTGIPACYCGRLQSNAFLRRDATLAIQLYQRERLLDTADALRGGFRLRTDKHQEGQSCEEIIKYLETVRAAVQSIIQAGPFEEDNPIFTNVLSVLNRSLENFQTLQASDQLRTSPASESGSDRSGEHLVGRGDGAAVVFVVGGDEQRVGGKRKRAEDVEDTPKPLDPAARARLRDELRPSDNPNNSESRPASEKGVRNHRNPDIIRRGGGGGGAAAPTTEPPLSPEETDEERQFSEHLKLLVSRHFKLNEDITYMLSDIFE